MKVLYLILLFLLGCNTQETNLTPYKGKPYRITFKATGASTTGGLMFWGKSDRGESFGKVGGSELGIVDLNPGNWTFYSMAWSTSPLTGVIACATETKNLPSYGAFVVEMQLANSKCNNPVFYGSDPDILIDTAGTFSLSSIKVTFCDALTAVTGSAAICTDEAQAVRNEKRGHSMSYRYSLHSYEKSGSSISVSSEKISTSCTSSFPISTYSGEATAEVSQIPSGLSGQNLPFFVRLESYPGTTNCDSSFSGARNVDFKNGIEDPDTITAKHFVLAGAPDKHKIYVKMGTDEICQGQSLTQDFAGGDAISRTFPLLICNIDQLYRSSQYTGSSFKLMNDIDLSSYGKGTNSHPSFSVIDAACVGTGSNFRPFGMNNTCLTSSHDFDFFGNDKTIKGMNLNYPASVGVGFISRKLSGAGTLWDLHFENSRVIGDTSTGVAVGVLQSIAINVTSTNAYVQSMNHTAGGLFGEARGGALKLIASKTHVVTANGNAGGIAGTSNTLSEALFSGKIISGGPSVGGLAGELVSGAQIRHSRVEGLVQGLSDVGGLVGMIPNSSFMVRNSYATAAVVATATANSGVGGLIGKLPARTGASLFSNSYFFGSISHSCALLNATCNVGNLVGSAPATWFGVAEPTLYYSTPTILALQTNTPVGTDYAPSVFLSGGGTFTMTDTDGFTSINQTTGDIPRLRFDREQHACRVTGNNADLINQILSLGRGTSAADPLMLCNSDQVLEMQTIALLYPGTFYQLATHIYDFNPQLTSTRTFDGTLDGDDYALMGKVIGPDGLSPISWWDTVTGTIKDLGFYSPYAKLYGTAPAPLEIVTRNNGGTLTNIEEIDVRWD